MLIPRNLQAAAVALVAAGSLIATAASARSVGARSAGALAATSQHKVMVILEENHSMAEALTQMPYLALLSSRFGKMRTYSAVSHPSLPNYLALGGGSTFRVLDDRDPEAHPIASPSVFGQTLAAHKSAKVYAESMPSNCALTNTASYAVRHNEWTYFNSPAERSGCNTYDVPMGTTISGNLADDIAAGTLPVTGQMTPNICNDGHDCSLALADKWLYAWMRKIAAGPDYRAGNLTVIVTFDEDDRSANNQVAFVVIDPRLHARTVWVPANHYAVTRWWEANAGVGPLFNAATAPGLRWTFGLR